MLFFDEHPKEDLKAFSSAVRHDLMKKRLHKVISETTLIMGQEYGFCKDEISEIIEECYTDLVAMIYPHTTR
ncbi:MAG: hypothetical protein RIC35_24030 [Marinoscillum sp.]